jgi:mRNA-degrading endonuclease toxin of MazEF toxin-antitoxin module
MRNLRQNAAFAAAVVLLLAVAGLTTAGSAGRDYSRCIKTCNSAHQACNTACNTDCKALCDNISSCVTPCVDNCKTNTCDAQMDECKLICQAIKNNPSPTNP